MNNQIPRVSIGLPVYNGERFIQETLDSLLAQTYTDFELIISDNASTDDTEAICRAYAAKDPRIRYYRNEENLGAAWNYNHVFELSGGEYFKWAACDDLCAAKMLEQCVEMLDQNPEVVVCFPKSKIIDEHGTILRDYPDGPNLLSAKITERFVRLIQSAGKWHAVCGLIRSSVLKKTRLIGNYIDPDGCLLAELSLYGKFLEIPEYLFFRRFHSDTSGSLLKRGGNQKFLEFLDPSLKGRILLPRWRRTFENCISVKRVPITIREKVFLFVYLVRVVIWDRHNYATELYDAIKQLLGKFRNCAWV